MNEQHLHDYLSFSARRVNNALAHCMPRETLLPQKLHTAMRYTALNGGKRIRACLVYATGQALGLPVDKLNMPACAVELIHAYSLVHDDLPAMDDDDLRRGKASCHKAYDEATAILVGDALQTLAFQIMADTKCDLPVEPTVRLEMIKTLAIASGSRGMAGGQSIDLDATGQMLSLAELENMHIHKTGALIRASVKLATLCIEDLPEQTFKKLDHYAKCIGLAFQVRDDILDISGNAKKLGKTPRKDINTDKVTYPALVGMTETKALCQQLVDDALNSLDGFDDKADPLRWIAQYIILRNH